MKKWLFAIVLMAALFVTANQASLTKADKSANSDVGLMKGRLAQSETAPQMKEDETKMAPLRSIAEALGATVDWNEATRTVTAVKDDITLELNLNKSTAQKNGHSIKLDIPPAIVKGTTMVSLGWINEVFGASVEWDEQSDRVYIDYAVTGLPVVGSYAKLESLLQQSQALHPSRLMVKFDQAIITMDSAAAASEEKIAAPLAKEKANSASGADYSATNTQVQGVDEADVVKTDGSYIYQVNRQKVIIAQAYPAENMKIVSTIRFEQDDFIPQEIYVDDKHLVIIGASFYEIPLRDEPAAAEKKKIAPYPNGNQTVQAKIYNISDKANAKLIREVEMDGNYVSSRKVGSSLYFVANKGMNYSYILNDQDNKELSAPSYLDTAVSAKRTVIGYDQLHYFPGSVEPNVLMVAGLNLDKPDQAVEISSYLGSGQNIYASENNLYVAVTQYKERPLQRRLNQNGVIKESIAVAPESSTRMYRFALHDGTVTFDAQGEVPGTILNQYSMDEADGYFRIATTQGDLWRMDENTSMNNLYVLDDKLKTAGKLEDLAPGEKIYSVRFMGHRAYVVTFKTVDPLFVIDLHNPEQPAVLGALKIPGYSDYLHPYDENHIIGFGKDTIELSREDLQGNSIGTTAFYMGMKLAIFDVSDVSHPIVLHQEIIGDRGTDSELLHNPKALLFSKDKHLLAFPVTVMEINNKANQAKSGFPQYGEFAFQGAYVYDIDLAKGFQLKGKITHLSADELNKAGNTWYDSNKNVERLLYIDDTLYTLSKSMIKAHDLSNLKEQSELELTP